MEARDARSLPKASLELLRRQAHRLRQEGHTWDSIASIVGVNRWTLMSWARRFGVGADRELDEVASARCGRRFGEGRRMSSLADEVGLRGEAAIDSGAGWGADILVNPIVPACGVAGAADPSVVQWDGFYYYCKSLNDQAIGVARAAQLQDIGKVPMLTIWAPPAGTDYSEQIWAPELQLVQGRWYIYFAASDGANVNHRMFVLEANTDDPQGAYTFKGKVTDSTDCWAIDGLTLEHDDGLYFVWSGWRSQADLFPQVTYIARMENPWTITGERHEIAAPDRTWEQAGAPLMEGHAILRREGKLFVAYSASASWTDDYTLGLLEYTGGDLLQPKSWAKSAAPVFTKLDSANSYGPGHNSFVKSPDGREDWIVYHAIDTSNGGWAQRSVRAQRFEWDQEGRPKFGLPVATGVPIAAPSRAKHSRRALVQTM